MTIDSPNNNIAEITLIGTGGGYGESIVAHVGDGNWIVIDSCIDPNTKESLPLLYLKEIGVDLEKNVRLILCTHWHDDHILGLSQLVEACPNSFFCLAKANDLKKFLRLIKLDYKKVDIEASNSSTIEFNKCIDLIEKRRTNPKKSADFDRVLLTVNLGADLKSEIISLSPSEYTMQCFDEEISTLITEYGKSSKRIIPKNPNCKSVVLLIKMGKHQALLGADLEVVEDDREGWLNILNHSQVLKNKSSLFKIPHHGSSNGFHERIWVELLEKSPIAKLTPWNKNNKLPQPDMLKKYSEKTDKLYMTTPLIGDKPKSRDRSIEKFIKKMELKIREVKYKKGIIRCRIDIADPNAKWQVALIENALHVNQAVA